MAPHFVAGIDEEYAAPIVAYMRGWSEERILAYCQSKGWRGELMGETEYKKYDSQIETEAHNMRLAKDPQVIDAGDNQLVKLTVVATSRSDRHSDMWLELTVQDRQSDFAKYLKKGDNLGWKGFPALRRWGDNNEKFSIEMVRVELFPSVELFANVKERGFVPGAKGKPAAKAPNKFPKKAPRKVVDLDDDLPAEE